MRKIVYILSMAAAIALASCQKGEELTPDVSSSSEVVFTSEISTRATGTTWDEGDKIGVFMYETGSSSVYFNSSNVEYTLTSGSAGTAYGSFTSENPLCFLESTRSDFVAYYPYLEGSSSGVVSINTADQTADIDFMVARTTNCSYASGGVTSLQFGRKMSKIVVTINREVSRPNATVSDISIEDIATEGTCTIANSSSNSVVASSTTSDIDNLSESTSNQIEAIIIPQTTTTAHLALIVDGEEFVANLSNTFVAGKQHNYTLTIGTEAVVFTEGTITDWEEVESGEMETTNMAFSASEISASNVPDVDTWIISDGGEITSTLISGVKEALTVATDAGRTISLIFPNATSIGERAFHSCSNFTTIELPEATSIGDYAFCFCSELTTVELPEAVTIGMAAFYVCENLTTIALPKAITIGSFAFYVCENLTAIELPKATSIGDSAFDYCKNLSTVELPEATSIGVSTFHSCYSLTTIELPKATSIGTYAFSGCTKLHTIVLPEVVTIGTGAFYYCDKLETLKLTVESAITCGEIPLEAVDDTSNITLYISSINSNVANLTDGTYTFKEIIYNEQ